MDESAWHVAGRKREGQSCNSLIEVSLTIRNGEERDEIGVLFLLFALFLRLSVRQKREMNDSATYVHHFSFVCVTMSNLICVSSIDRSMANYFVHG